MQEKSLSSQASSHHQHADARKENNSLNRARYAEKKGDFPFSYVMVNKKNGKVVEIKAYSPYHACKMLGWRERHVKVVAKDGVPTGVAEEPKSKSEPVAESSDPMPPTSVM